MNAPLKSTPGSPLSRSPERDALAAAIELCGTATSHAASVSVAIETARSKVWEADAEVPRARQAVEDAKLAAAAHLTAMAMGTAEAAPLSIKAARQALADAEDALEAAIASRDNLLAYQAQADQQASHARYKVEKAIVPVITSEARTLVFDMIRQHCAARSRLARAHRDIAFLIETMGIRLNDLPPGLSRWDDTFWADESNVPSPWTVWVKELERNADAALPIAAP